MVFPLLVSAPSSCRIGNSKPCPPDLELGTLTKWLPSRMLVLETTSNFFTSEQWHIMQKGLIYSLNSYLLRKLYIIRLAEPCIILRSYSIAHLLVKISSVLPTNNRTFLYILKSALPANTVSGLAHAG